MANFHGHQMTMVGQNLLAKLAATGRPLNYSSVKVGDGQLGGQSISGLTGLIGLKKSLGIARTPMRTQDGRWDVVAVFNNRDITTGFYLREWGIFATDPDTALEVLIIYANAGSESDYIPAWDGSDLTTHVEFSLTASCIVSSDITVTAEIDPSQIYAMQSDVDALGNRIDNLTPADIGAVPITRTINGKALSADIVLGASDVGAATLVDTVGVLLQSQWSATAPYTQVITMPGVYMSDRLIIGPMYDSAVDVRRAQREIWGMVSMFNTQAGAIQFICDDERPGIDLPILIRIERG